MIKRVRTLFLFFCVTIGCIYADNGDSWDNHKVVSTEGNDFWVTLMLNTGMRLTGEPPVLHLIGAARQETTVIIEYPGTGIQERFTIPAGKSKEYLLNTMNNDKIYCEDSGSTLQKSIHVYSENKENFSLYAANQGSASFDASIVIPTHALRKEYILQTYKDDMTATEFAIIAVEDNTQIKITPKEDLDIDEFKAGSINTITLRQGQVFFARSKKAKSDLSGTIICSDKKIAVFNGGQSAAIPTSSTNDHIFEQNISTLNWGKDFCITQTKKQNLNKIRITAAENDTKVYQNGNSSPICTLSSKETYDFSLEEGTLSTYLHADKPVLTYLYMTSSGSNYDPDEKQMYGDPSVVMMASDEQGLKDMIFGTFHGSEFSSLTHYVNIVCPTNNVKTMLLDGQPISSEWTYIMGNPEMQFTRLAINEGGHTLSNTQSTFNAYIYGIGVSESYAYSVGFDNQPQAAYILIDGKRIQTKGPICINQTTDFEGVVNYKYDQVDWKFTNISQNDVRYEQQKKELSKYKFPSGGDWRVEMIVKRCSPVCPCSGEGSFGAEYDTIRALVRVKDTYNSSFHQTKCVGDVVTIQGRDENGNMQTYTYTENTHKDLHLYTVDGCDSIIKLDINFIPPPEPKTIYETVCNSYTWHEKTYTESGTYPWEGQNENGCNAQETLVLTINKSVTGPTEERTICKGSSITWNGQTINKSGSYYATLTAANGCDSTCTILIKEENDFRSEISETICEGEKFTWRGEDRTENKTYTEHAKSKTSDCDSTFILHLRVAKKYNITAPPIDYCDGQTYKFGTQNLTQTGTYTETFQSVDGCDSTVTLTITFHPAEKEEIYDTICSNSSYTFDGKRLNQTGTYTSISQSNIGCSKTTILHLTVLETSEKRETVQICASQLPYTYGKQTTGVADKSGDYSLFYKGGNAVGCDSTYYLHLDVVETMETNLEEWRCDYEGAYSHPDKRATELQNLTKSGIYQHIYTSVLGCDSIVYLTLHVGSRTTAEMKVRLCPDELPWTDPYTGRQLSQDTTYNDTIQNVSRCDSVITILFSVKPAPTTTIDTTICESELPYNHPDKRLTQFQGLVQTGTYTQSVASAEDCDSTVILNLTVYPTTYDYKTVVICEEQLPYLLGEHKRKLYESGVYRDTLISKNQYGCDSILTVNLTVLHTIRDIKYDTICSDEAPYNYSDSRAQRLQNLTKTGTYFDTLSTVSGCDSILELRLIVGQTYPNLHEKISMCQNDTLDWNGIPLLGSWGVTDTTFVARLTTIYGCDSIVTLHLQIHPTYEFITSARICYSDVYEWRGKSYNASGVYYDSLKTVTYGCDSVYVLELYVKPALLINRNAITCDNDTAFHRDTLWYSYNRWEEVKTILWRPGMERTEQRDLIFLGADGCDSIIYRYQLTINETYLFVDSANLCSNERYLLKSGNYVSADTLYDPLVSENVQDKDTLLSDTLKTIHGCDSVYAVYSTVYPQYLHVDYDTICSDDSLFWRGHLYNDLSAGEHVFADSFVTVRHGCDSVYQLRLYVNPRYFFELHESICDFDTYDFNDSLIHDVPSDIPYFFTDSMTSVAGCDSIYHLYLTILPTEEVVEYDTFCLTDPYDFHGVELYKSGYYRDTTQQFDRCLITNLYLTVEDPTKVWLDIGELCAEGTLEIPFHYEGRTPVGYSVFFDDFAHSQRFEDMLTVPFDHDSVVKIPIPYGDVIPVPSTHPAYLETYSDGHYEYLSAEKQQYPYPGTYGFTVTFQNGVCSDNLIRVDTTFSLNFPHWIHEQHWNDALLMFKDTFNGGYAFDEYQWYRNDSLLGGEIDPFIYLPHELSFGQAYKVRVHIVNEPPGIYHFTCPIYPVRMYDAIVPTKEYFSVVPTVVHAGLDGVDILSNTTGTYSVHTAYGSPIAYGRFGICYKGHPATHIYLQSIPDVWYIIVLHADSGESRTVKVYHE